MQVSERNIPKEWPGSTLFTLSDILPFRGGYMVSFPELAYSRLIRVSVLVISDFFSFDGDFLECILTGVYLLNKVIDNGLFN